MIQAVAPTAVPWDLLLAADPSRSVVQSYLYRSQTYVQRHDQQIVGELCLTPVKPDAWEITNLAVAPGHQHQGVARALLDFAIRTCQRNPACATLWIGTGNSSLRQLAIYQRAGFEIQTVWVDHFVDNYPEPLYEDGIRCRSMVRLSLTTK